MATAASQIFTTAKKPQGTLTVINGSAPISQYTHTKVIHFYQQLLAASKYAYNWRTRLLTQDKLYMREVDLTQTQVRAAAANRAGNVTKVQNVTVPVVGPQVDSGKAYFVEMFLSSYPIFPVVTKPGIEDIGLQLETILGQSAIYYQWPRQLAMAIHDGLKYNLQAVEVDWCTENIPAVVSDPSTDMKFGVPKQIAFSGNKIKRLDPYNLLFDWRVPIAENHKRGEFGGYTELLTRIELLQLFDNLDPTETLNKDKAFQTPTQGTGLTGDMQAAFYLPQVNPDVMNSPMWSATNWLAWSELDTRNRITHQGMYEVTRLYVRMLPNDAAMRVPSALRHTPMIYKFIIVNQQTIIYVRRMTNAHGMLPIIIGQVNDDGLGLQTKSYAENASPYQQLASSLYNSALHSQRRKVYDRLFYDPSRIAKADIDKPDAIARIPVKQEAYGKPVSEAFAVAPYRDEGVANILGIARDVVEMANIATGSNRVQQGQFQKGNKTRSEFETVMSNSDSRLRTSAMLLGGSWFAPIKECLKYNILQYQLGGILFNQDQQKEVTIDPAKLREIAWEFQLADGSLPSDKIVNFELFGQMLQYAGMNPQLAMDYDLVGMFVYQLKLQGARWVDNFKRTEDQKMALMQQTAKASVAGAAGNVVAPPQQGAPA